jgi:hypothetical protein
MKFQLYTYKTKRFGYKSVLYAGAKLSNAIPVYIKDSEGVKEFKSKMLNWKRRTVNSSYCLSFVYHGSIEE